ncbi:MAG: ABC transporter substrate-binding protein [Microbacterium sp.]
MSLSSTIRRRLRVGASIAAVAAAAITLSACSADDSDSGSTSESDASDASFGEITLQLSWILNEEFSGEFIADSSGYYTDAGFDKVNLVPGPSTGAAELLGGTADIAVSDAVAIGTAVANEDAPLKIIGTTYQENPFTVLSLKDGADIETPQDLIGKKIGVQDSNTSLFQAMLKANDIDPSEVTVVPVQYDPAPLVNGEVDGFIAYVTNEKITVESEGYETASLTMADNGLPFVAETITVTQDTIDNNPDMLKAFLKAEIQGWTDQLADPQKGVDLAINTYGADLGLDADKSLAGAEAQNELITSDETDENGIFTISDELQQQTIDSLAGAGIDLDVSDLFDTSLVDAVYEENPDLK